MSYRIIYANASGGASFSGRTIRATVERATVLASLGYKVTITDLSGKVVAWDAPEVTRSGDPFA